jgi:hypothetical protein
MICKYCGKDIEPVTTCSFCKIVVCEDCAETIMVDDGAKFLMCQECEEHQCVDCGIITYEHICSFCKEWICETCLTKTKVFGKDETLCNTCLSLIKNTI